MDINKLYTPLQTLKYRQRRGQNLRDQKICHIENVNLAHDRNLLNPSKGVTKISMVFTFIFTQAQLVKGTAATSYF